MVRAGRALRQFLGELDALRFAARKRGRRLAELDVAEADVEQRLELLLDLRDVLKQRQRLFDRRVEQVGDGLALVLHRQRLAVVARAAADVAEDVDVGQEVHLDALHAVALARLAAPALDVEGEAAGLVAALARFGQHRVQLADGREEPGVGRGVRARRAADGRLVDLDHLVDVLQPFDRVVLARLCRASRRGGARARGRGCRRRASTCPSPRRP